MSKARAFERVDAQYVASREIVQLPYWFTIPIIEKSFGIDKDFFNNQPTSCYSRGGQVIKLEKAITIGGTSLYAHRDGATMIGLDADTEDILENYILGTNVNWSRKSIFISNLPQPIMNLPQAVSLHGEYMNQWGHVMGDLIFRALSTLHVSRDIPVLIPSDLPENGRVVLQKILGERHYIDIQNNSAVSVKELWVPLPRTRTIPGWKPYLDPITNGWAWQFDGPAVKKIQEFWTSYSKKQERFRRIYLSRAGFQNRRLVNEEKVHSVCEKYNIEVIHPQRYALSDLISILDETKLVISPLGSQLDNLFLCSPGIDLITIGASEESRFGYTTAVSYAGHREIRVFSNKLDSPENTPYESKQAPQVVDLSLLDAAILELS